MVTATGWIAAPAGKVLLPGGCPARDADRQGCARSLVHVSLHQSTGLRSWLETANEDALIRCYDVSSADKIEAMETPLFATFGFAPIARQTIVRTRKAGLNTLGVLVVGLLAPSEKVTIRVRVVCFARTKRP